MQWLLSSLSWLNGSQFPDKQNQFLTFSSSDSQLISLLQRTLLKYCGDFRSGWLIPLSPAPAKYLLAPQASTQGKARALNSSFPTTGYGPWAHDSPLTSPISSPEIWNDLLYLPHRVDPYLFLHYQTPAQVIPYCFLTG